MTIPTLKLQEVPFDAPDTCCLFRPSATKPFVAAPAALELYGDAIPGCLAVLRPLAALYHGIDYLQVFTDPEKAGAGVVVFRVAEPGKALLQLRTTEDIFLLAWGTDELSYRAKDLDSIRRWTEKAAWEQLLRVHHTVRPKPKGKPTYHLVSQMIGEHGYRRFDALKSLAQGLAGKLPASWLAVEENAAVEVWLSINGAMAVCGMRLSDRTMRHRTYKYEHLPASLRPTIAAAMVRLADLKPGQTVLDPFCGAGTILAETQFNLRDQRGPDGGPWPMTLLGSDVDSHHVKAAATNLRALGDFTLDTFDARRLPYEPGSIDRIISNPPFGKQLSTPEEVGPLYRDAVRSMDRVLRPGGKAVLLVSDVAAVREAAKRVGWHPLKQLGLRVLGQRASIQIFRKEN